MRSVESSVQGWNRAARSLAVVLVLVAQALGMEAVWSQELPHPRIDEEFAKQEKIYRRRGAGSYTSGRRKGDANLFYVCVFVNPTTFLGLPRG